MEPSRKPVRRFYCCPANNQVEGPFALVELAGLLHASHITGETLTLLEGEEQWLPFQDRPEYNFAREMPREMVTQHIKEKTEEQESSFSPRKLLTFAWVMAPLFLYLLYRFGMMYLRYEMHSGTDSGAAPSDAP
jgi:hypothetical protein